jgi:non-heme chloroperoxidase
MPYVESHDGTKVFYNDWGAGRPVVLIHGWPLNSDMWEYQSIPLASHGLRVITYDRRGFGRSEQPWGGYDYDTLAQDLAALFDKLELREAVLVGFSMGGGEVARYLSRYGADRVRKVVLVSAVTPFLLKTSSHEQGVDRAVFNEMVAGLQKDRPGFLASFMKKFYGAGLLHPAVSSEILKWSEALALQGSPKATLDCIRAFSETDFRPDMRAFTMPTLIIHGDADATVPIDPSGRATAKLIAQAELREYAGAAHGLFYTERERLTADLLAFVR